MSSIVLGPIRRSQQGLGDAAVGHLRRTGLGKYSNRNLTLELDILLRTRLLVQASSGYGKSWLLRRLAEQLARKMQVIIIDPEGEFASLREKYDYSLAAKTGGDTPADVRSAALLAQKLLEYRAPAVCDIFELKAHERHAWVRLFLESLIDAPKKFWHPVVVIVDEAAMFAPEKAAGESEATDAMIQLATKGRKRGFAAVFATQRLGNLNKNAAATLFNVLIGGTMLDIDQKRAALAMGVARDSQAQFFQDLKLVKPGDFFALGPAISNERILMHVGPIETTHPESGSGKYAAEPPPPPEKVKALLPKLADLPRAAEEKAKTESELRAEIRTLKAQIRSAPTKTETRIERVADPRAITQAIKDTQREFRAALSLRDTAVKKLSTAMATIAKIAASKFPIDFQEVPTPVPAESHPPTLPRHEGTDKALSEEVSDFVHAVSRSRRTYGLPDAGLHLRDGARRMIQALCTWFPNSMTLGQMRAHAGLKKSGTFSAYMSDLRRAGLIEEDGQFVRATQQAVEQFGTDHPMPKSTEEVVAVWAPKLRNGARRMLEALISRGGEPISKEELGQLAGLTKSGTFSAYLSDLKTARLALVHRDGTVAADRETLFL